MNELAISSKLKRPINPQIIPVAKKIAAISGIPNPNCRTPTTIAAKHTKIDAKITLCLNVNGKCSDSASSNS